MSYIENTWVAYAFDRPVAPERIEQSLERVRSHYAAQYAEPLRADVELGANAGMALWRRPDPRLRWEPWARGEETVVASTNAVTGWGAVAGDVGIADAALALGRALAENPERTGDLTPPFVVATFDTERGRLAIVNDFLASARLYELHADGVWVWSNRLGALPLFAGQTVELDAKAWAVHAAAGWFLGDATPIRDARKVPPASAITVDAGPQGARVRTTRTGAVRGLVRPRRASLADQAKLAARASVALSRSLASIWDAQPTINVSGGRDSRITAAGAIMAGLDARFRTMDIEPGEVEAARELLAAAPTQVDHGIMSMERGDPADSLFERVGATHLVHDGVANPMGGQGSTTLPQEGFVAPLMTGHGGELGHGFYYDRARLRRELVPATRRRLVRRLERSGRQRHASAREEAYALYLAEVELTLDEGRAHGVRGASLLDYYYLAQRLPFRAGLGSRSDRYSACVTPAFVRGCFDLSPRRRTRAALHRAVIAELIPAWNAVPFFHGGGGRMRPMKRARIWEKPRHARDMEEILASPELWAEAFDPGRIQAMWREARAGEGHSHYESAFMRIAWRVCFVEHARALTAKAQARRVAPGSAA